MLIWVIPARTPYRTHDGSSGLISVKEYVSFGKSRYKLMSLYCSSSSSSSSSLLGALSSAARTISVTRPMAFIVSSETICSHVASCFNFSLYIFFSSGITSGFSILLQLQFSKTIFFSFYPLIYNNFFLNRFQKKKRKKLRRMVKMHHFRCRFNITYIFFRGYDSIDNFCDIFTIFSNIE